MRGLGLTLHASARALDDGPGESGIIDAASTAVLASVAGMSTGAWDAVVGVGPRLGPAEFHRRTGTATRNATGRERTRRAVTPTILLAMVGSEECNVSP